MRAGAPLWRENAQRRESSLKGFLNARQWLEGIVTTLPRKESAGGTDLCQQTVTVQLICLLACPGQVILTFQDEGLDAGPRQIPALRCRRKSYGAHVQQLLGLLRYTAEGDHLVWNISDIHPSSSGGGHRGSSWCVCSTSWIIQSYLLLGFFCSRVFPSTRALVSRLDISGFK